MTDNAKAPQKMLLLLEDDEVQRGMLTESGKHYFGDDAAFKICVAQSTNQAIEELDAFLSTTPNASLFAVMDYNMGVNQPGERKPTDSLFFNDTFLKYLDNGAIIIIYSGYPEQVRQSQIFYEQFEKNDNVVFLLAVKSEVPMDDLFRMLKATKNESIEKLKKIAKTFQYDLGKLLEYMAGQHRNR